MRGSVLCGTSSGWSVPCVSIQLTLSHKNIHRVTRPLRGSVSCGSGWSVPCVSIQLTLSQHRMCRRSRFPPICSAALIPNKRTRAYQRCARHGPHTVLTLSAAASLAPHLPQAHICYVRDYGACITISAACGLWGDMHSASPDGAVYVSCRGRLKYPPPHMLASPERRLFRTYGVACFLTPILAPRPPASRLPSAPA